MVADFDADAGEAIEQDVHARTELDQADALTTLQAVSNFRMEDDAARQQSRDLLEDHFLAVAFNRDNVLLVLVGGYRVHGVEKLAVLIADFAHHSRDGERFTCTSKTLRKMLMRSLLARLRGHVETSVTLPSPGETIAPGVLREWRAPDRERTRERKKPAGRDDRPGGAGQPAHEDSGREKSDNA